MRVNCPNCAAAYEVPDAVLAGGKTLRCARCGTDWAPLPAPPPPAPPPAPIPAAEPPPLPVPVAGRPAPPPATRREVVPPMRVLPPPPPRPGPSLAIVLAAWLASAAVLGAAGWAGWTYRAQIERAWPPSGRVYALFQQK